MEVPMRPLFRLASLPLLSLALAAVATAQRPELVIQTGHDDAVSVVAFAPDSRLLASGSSDNTIRLWDTTNGTELRALKGHTRPVLSLAFARDGRALASGSADQTIKLWDTTNGRQLRVLGDDDGGGIAGGVAALAFDVDGRTLTSVSLDITQGESGLRYALSFKHWDYTTGQLLRSSSALCGQVIAVALSPDGRMLASGGFDEPITLWDAESGRKLRTFVGGNKVVEAVAFSPDGRTLVGAGRLWDVATGRELRALDEYDGGGAFSPDGRTLALIEGRTKIKLLTVATGEITRTFEGPQLGINCLAFSPDGRTLASGDGDFVIRLRDTAAGRDAGTLRGHTGAVKAVAFTSDGRTLVTGHRMNLFQRDTLRLWDTTAGRQPRVLTGPRHSPTGIALSGDGRTLMAGEAGNSVYVWDVTTGRALRTLKVGLTPDAIALSADGQTLACGGRDKTIKIFDAASGLERRTLAGTLTTTYALAITPDGHTLARGGPAPIIELWDATRGQQISTLAGHAANVNALAFSPDGRVLASGSHDRSVMLWDASSGRELHRLSGHTGAVYAVAFSADGRLLASGSEDNTVKLWDVSTGRELLTLKGHTDAVLAVAFRNDGRVLASGSADTTVKLWSLPTGQELASLFALDGQGWLVVTPDGLFDGSPAAWSQILWRFSPSLYDIYPVEYFFNEFYYPDLLPDIFAGRRPAARRDIAQKDRRPPHLKLSPADGASPARNATARNVKLTISVSDAPAGAQDVRLFRNGALVKVWHGDVLRGQATVTLTADVPVGAGENQFNAYAFNRDNIKSADAALSITGADSLKRNGTAYVVAVGVNQYGPNPFFQNLKYAVADADDFAAEVKGQQEHLASFERVEVVELTDDKATKMNVLGALAGLAKKAQPEDAVVVYFAGHGLAEGGRFYLIPHDIGASVAVKTMNERATLDAMLAAYGISDVELEDAFEGIDAGQLTLIVDACNSGQALGGEREGRGPMNAKGLAQLAYDKGMYILTAAQSFQAAQEAPQIGHGLLTYALVEEGLKQALADDEPNDGQIVAREWLDYATNRVPEMQIAKMRAAHGRGLNLSFKDEERGLDVDLRSGQRPRVFYRRELEAQPFVIAKPRP
jgi:WD40 repeat protein